jgi:plasmid stability protein
MTGLMTTVRFDIMISRYRMESDVAQLVVRDIEEDVKIGLRRRAKRHGRSMEAEVREILRDAAKDEAGTRQPLGSRLRARFAGVGLEKDIREMRGQKVRPAAFR